jgi:hypothetical protein
MTNFKSSNRMEGALAAIRTRKRHNHIALGSGCTLVLCGDLQKVQRRAANRNAAFQEWTESQPDNIIHPAE